jgi:hypothetical protein
MKRIHMWAAGVGAGAIAVTAAISPVAFAHGPEGGKGHEPEYRQPQHKSQPAFAKVKHGKTWHESNVDPCKKYPFKRSPDLSVSTTGGKKGAPVTVSGKVSVNGCDLVGLTVHLVDGKDLTTVTGAGGTFTFTDVKVSTKKHKPESLTVYTDGNSKTGLYPAMTRVELANTDNFRQGHKPEHH